MKFEDRLVEIFDENEFDLYDRESFIYLINELSEINTLYTNLLMMAFDSGLFEEISEEIVLDQEFFDEHVNVMERDYGLTHENAVWLVDVCCSVYGEGVCFVDCEYVVPKISDTETLSQNNTTYISKYDKESVESIDLDTFRRGEKIPKIMVQRVTDAEQDLYIEDFAVTVSKDGELEDVNCIKVAGEITSYFLRSDILIFIMVYNDADEIIGASFNKKIYSDDCDGVATFADDVFVPKGELISRIVVRPVQDPLEC